MLTIFCLCVLQSLVSYLATLSFLSLLVALRYVLLVMMFPCFQARGIDIPMLDNIINYNFPSKSKLFIHRVGRVARAGRSGTAYSFVAPDEVPYVLDLHLFLGRSLKLATKSDEEGVQDGLLGTVPQRIIDEEEEYIRHVLETSPDLVSVQCGLYTVLD